MDSPVEDLKNAAGLLMFRKIPKTGLEFFLAHPGGPYFKNKDKGVWTIPKGLVHLGENALTAAIREFQEETGIVPLAPFFPLGEIKQKNGKIVHAWAFEGAWDEAQKLASNRFKIEWPPRSGKLRSFPEIDRASWFSYEEAQERILPAQLPLLQRATVANY